jgi:hypothetical protein
MIIPKFWAEARLQTKLPSRQITVKRWGWSDASQEAAQALANERAAQAMERIIAGDDLRRREAKDSYGTADGVPIREEVVSRHGHAVVTRNSYGSLCLNTPNVLFADVDALWSGRLKVNPLGCLSLFVAGIVIGLWQKSLLIGAGIAIGLPWLWSTITNQINAMRRPAGEVAAKEQSLSAIRACAAAHPEWHLRVYETPAGYRLLAMHDVFDPKGDSAKAVLDALNSDKRFVVLCALQACFRARVSPKYWRAGYKPKVALPKSKWPFPLHHLEPRRQWVEGYNAVAGQFASCRFIERLGAQTVHPEAEAVRVVHDELCRAESSLPLA